MNKTLRITVLVFAVLTACNSKKPDPAPKPSEEKEEAGRREGVIILSPEAVKAAVIEVAAATRRPLAQGVVAAARLTLTQEGQAKVSARVAGRIATVRVQLGRKVKRGDVLAELESPELGRMRADYLAASTKARIAEQNYRREQELNAKGISSTREMQVAEGAAAEAKAELDAADARLHALGLSEEEVTAAKVNEHFSARFPARSPIDGTVVDIKVTAGQGIESSAELFSVANLTKLWAIIDVFEAQLPLVHKGATVALTVPAVPDQRFSAVIDYIGDVVDEKSHAVEVRLLIDNAKGLLKPGMFVNAEVLSAKPSSGIDGGGEGEASRVVVARESVQKAGERQVVFVQVQPGRYKPVDVRLGTASEQDVEVLSGIAPSDLVVTKGAFVLKSELVKDTLGEGE